MNITPSISQEMTHNNPHLQGFGKIMLQLQLANPGLLNLFIVCEAVLEILMLFGPSM